MAKTKMKTKWNATIATATTGNERNLVNITGDTISEVFETAFREALSKLREGCKHLYLINIRESCFNCGGGGKIEKRRLPYNTRPCPHCKGQGVIHRLHDVRLSPGLEIAVVDAKWYDSITGR